MAKDSNTEQNIIDAANRIFTKNGWAGSRMQDIANEANINKAMLHYYFKNKEQLFQMVFKKKIKELVEIVLSSIPENANLETMIRIFVDKYISFISKTPELPLFILNEVYRHPDLLDDVFSPVVPPVIIQFATELEKEINQGKVRPIPIQHLIMNMLSLCIFPIIAKPILKKFLFPDEQMYADMIEERKGIVVETLLNDLKLNP
jgi:AcrR family transcriptional regulator